MLNASVTIKLNHAGFLLLYLFDSAVLFYEKPFLPRVLENSLRENGLDSNREIAVPAVEDCNVA